MDLEDLEEINNAKELYDYYKNFDAPKAKHYEQLIKLQKSTSSITDSGVLLKYLVNQEKKVGKKEIKPLRQRLPRKGYAKTVAEFIEEIMHEKNKPLSVKQLLDYMVEKRGSGQNAKNFSSQLNTISLKTGRFMKKKINTTIYWGLSEWDSGIGFKKEYFNKIEK